MKAQEYGLDVWQMAVLECFHLSLNVLPSMGGVHYHNDYNVIKDYAQEKSMNAIEMLSVCLRLKNELQQQ